MNKELSVALVSIARPTFDLPLAQSVADTVRSQLTWAGYNIAGTGSRLVMDGAAVDGAIAALQNIEFDMLVLLQASFADSSMAVAVAEAIQAASRSALVVGRARRTQRWTAASQ